MISEKCARITVDNYTDCMRGMSGFITWLSLLLEEFKMTKWADNK